MSVHAYTNCWIHLIWSTYKRQQYFDPATAAQVSRFLRLYAHEQGLHLPVNYVNSDHVHCLIDLPASTSLEHVVKLLKGASSHWINPTRLVPMKFYWDEATAHFLFPEGISIGFPGISYGRRSITGKSLSRKNTDVF